MVKLNHHLKTSGQSYKSTWMKLLPLSMNVAMATHFTFQLLFQWDLCEIVSERLAKQFPDDTKATPSEEWVQLQFWPKIHMQPMHYVILAISK